MRLGLGPGSDLLTGELPDGVDRVVGKPLTAARLRDAVAAVIGADLECGPAPLLALNRADRPDRGGTAVTPAAGGAGSPRDLNGATLVEPEERGPHNRPIFVEGAAEIDRAHRAGLPKQVKDLFV